MTNQVETLYHKLTAALTLAREPVGVKFLFTQEEYDQADAKAIKARTPYCVMVKLATRGNPYKSTLEFAKCSGGTRAIGMETPSADYQCGCEYNSFGLYENLAVAQKVVENMTFCGHRIYGVMIKPLHMYKDLPDVAIIITNPYNAMRLVQGYTYHFGTKIDFKLAGNQALCSECTAYPFETNSMNLSMLCAGTRYLAGWDVSEMAVGIAGSKLEAVIDGLYLSINGAETNSNKVQIVEKIADKGLNDPGIYQDDAYFMKE